MKITTTILSIPPYLSTAWKNISSLHVREERGLFTLMVWLENGTQVEVPSLDSSTVDEIFKAHARFLEESSPLKNPISFSLPLKPEGPIETLGASMQHNPAQSHLPPLPPEVLEKITLIARAFGLEDSSFLTPPEPECGCIYCQVTRSLQGGEDSAEVTEEDLKFRNWEIQQTSDKLYCVTNPLDANEHYNVFLGTPLGCTCGSKNCEHIRAVLNT